MKSFSMNFLNVQYHIINRATSKENYFPLKTEISLLQERQPQTSNYKYLHYSKNNVLFKHTLTFMMTGKYFKFSFVRP